MTWSTGKRSFHNETQLSILALRLRASSDEMIFWVIPSSGFAPPLSNDTRQTSNWRKCESKSFFETKPWQHLGQRKGPAFLCTGGWWARMCFLVRG